jgi:hypothetical protein
MATTEQLQTWLDQAVAARHKLLTGSITERWDYEGRSMTFTKVNIGELQAYIRELEFKLGMTATGRTKAILPRF